MKRGASGFSLVEVMIALFLLGVGLLAVVPMFVYGTRNAAASADFGKVGGAAVARMELLRANSFGSLAAGGSLSSNVTSYSDTTNPAAIVRWTIADDASPATVKTINVRAIARRQVLGRVKQIQLSTKRSL